MNTVKTRTLKQIHEGSLKLVIVKRRVQLESKTKVSRKVIGSIGSFQEAKTFLSPHNKNVK